ncbi:MAG TPA: ATPase, T2SS/T4P/T4SS family, partial [Candidatus Binatia bacterium]|nr:ATPase, T2SS/T4P/T4SS family [Candidatus Binatia bacterium]
MSAAQDLAAACALPVALAPPALPDRALLAPLPMQYARRHLVLPLARDAHGLDVAIADPTALAPLDDLRFLYGLPVRPLVVPAAALRDAIGQAYDAAARADADAPEGSLEQRLELEPTPLDEANEPPDLLEAGGEAPVIRLVNALLFEAVRAGASDVHVEPFERALVVRLRVDGALHDLLSPPLRLHAALVSRIKIMAGLDIAERRLPQDGRIAIRVGGRDVDLRVSIVPTASGERVVLRLLDRASVLRDLADLGLSPAIA